MNPRNTSPIGLKFKNKKNIRRQISSVHKSNKQEFNTGNNFAVMTLGVKAPKIATTNSKAGQKHSQRQFTDKLRIQEQRLRTFQASTTLQQ